ncbi:exodeoxyribonuclease V subunit gamma [Kushneria phosphatilytica]|uniref:RecBCD enzyme subunit RecC n=1 Tax=Kushneria phosphatilytica TaxID=657387 RepID=A0A1S1NXI4_9GAMM|nr:exodeoxyribonuclease V subunit gamma [Kushneria phosphatilytica]OHV12178.1 exodeoxyribonuclease V subunit gamma [Kushneria phosphatilytica]QEL11370.1 exodeoxyribonuclease V subunit gamma [Kushneria phosphatilytica]
MFTVLHANHLEDLRDLALSLSTRQPLAALDNETFLVQSNGMAQWLQLSLAERLGVAAANDFPLPSSFVWRAYRAVLGSEIPEQSPFDKQPMTWRLMRLLPTLLDEPEFTPLAHYLADELPTEGTRAEERDVPCGDRKCYQLAGRLADLFDQYLVYRPDWITAWERGERAPTDLPTEEAWQPRLWRALLEDASPEERHCHRAALHDRFLHASRELTCRPAMLPPRLVVFGISALPHQLLEALHALSGVMDVVLMIANPCRYYWGDIVADREVLRAQMRADTHRQRHAEHPRLTGLDEQTLHLRANPLLASWGAHGRDFIEALYEFEADNAFDLEHDVFRDWIEQPEEASLLHQIQQDILDLAHPAERAEQSGRRTLGPDDDSLRLTSTHSPMREVEILHDQLLDAFERDPTLKPRDIVVMVPDIDRYAPFIEAVFGQVSRADPRYIPFTVADRLASESDPLMQCLLGLLELPERRLGVTELLDWLDVPAFRRRFGIRARELETLQRWLQGSGVRWGLDGDHRAALGLPALHDNTWQFGLERMLLGYAMGDACFEGIAAYDEIGGLEADLAGRLASLVRTLERRRQEMSSPADPVTWGTRLNALLDDLIAPEQQQEFDIRERLEQAIDSWLEACRHAHFTSALPLSVVRDALTAELDEGGLSQRFLAGRVNFATLMPMRAIPFRQTWLLGMNDGDYPRVRLPQDFDLMVQRHRSGDRSRRDDDRYLFLEALLSTRDRLNISWVGRDQRDNTPRPPSILVSELLDTLALGWQVDPADVDHDQTLRERLITEHPLQPFSERYFAPDSMLFTYESAWEGVHDGTSRPGVEGSSDVVEPPADALGLEALTRLLRQPVMLCLGDRLGVHFQQPKAPVDDAEPFALDGLDRFELKRSLIEAVRQGAPSLESAAESFRMTGQLPALGFGSHMIEALLPPLKAQLASWQEGMNDLLPAEPVTVRWRSQEQDELLFEERIDELHHDNEGRLWWWALAPSHYGHLRCDRAGRLIQYGKPIRLLRAWLMQQAVTAQGTPLHIGLVFEDRVLRLSPPVPEQAQQRLDRLLGLWWQAYRQPMAAHPELAFVYLAGMTGGASDDERNEALERVRRHYEEDGFNGRAALRSREPALGELWPTFEQLWQAGFESHLEALYGDFHAAVRLLAGSR